MRFPLARMSNRRLGMTLIEMLVAMVITLMIVFAMVQLFQSLGDTMSEGKSLLELDGRMRNALERFRGDIDRLTVTPIPPADGNSGPGYLEIVEGALNDNTAINAIAAATDTSLGDYDDLIMFTASSGEQPFLGRYQGGSLESREAEIVWWTVLADLNNNGTRDAGEYFTLYRRVLLVLPDLNDPALGYIPVSGNYNNETKLTNFQQANDISVRLDGNGHLVANSLADLSVRSNRFAHQQLPGNYPNRLNVSGNANRLRPLSGARLGDDIILTDVLAFDLRLYDPLAPVRTNNATGGVALTPGDPGWSTATVTLGTGAFVDMNYFGADLSHFSNRPYNGQNITVLRNTAFSNNLPSAVYDTWSTLYEHDGYDQNGIGGIDEGANGIDDNSQFGADDAGERETVPPYAYPLRGIQLTLRVIEVPTKKVVQSSVAVDFSTD